MIDDPAAVRVYDEQPAAGRTGHGWPAPAARVTVGDGVPLTAAYCAERAAAAIEHAEKEPELAADRWFKAAEHWRTLACSLATNSAMNRPRDDRDNDRGRR